MNKNGTPEGIRTPDPQIRNLLLYPAELREHFVVVSDYKYTNIF